MNEQRLSRTDSYFTYRADLVNTGGPRAAMTATVVSKAAGAQVAPGQGSLRFAPIPANGQVTSSNTFTILVDRTVPFDFSNLQWTFLGPVANAGPNQTVKVGSTVTLNGSNSNNPSGSGTLLYNWTFTSRPPGSAAKLLNATDVMPSFVVDAPGDYIVALTVGNNVGTDTTSVTISTLNSPPVANAGPDQTVGVGSVVTLNGSGSSDVDGDPLTFSWALISRPAGSTATLTASNTVAPVFTADKAGAYLVQLTTNDGKLNSSPATVTITTQNTPPVANAGPSQTVNTGSLVQLNGAGSTDVDGDPLTYQWSLITVPSGSTAKLANPAAVNPSFSADRQGAYVAQLIVNDGKLNSVPATVTITTSGPRAPAADAGPNVTVKHGTPVTLNGKGTDPQGLKLTMKWALLSKAQGSSAALSNATTANPSFVADVPGIYVAQLIVNNGSLDSEPSTVTITTTNTAPVANAGTNQTASVGSVVTLDGSESSDADNDPLSYYWSLTSRPDGSSAMLSAPNSPAPTFFTDVPGTYVLQLLVKDKFASSAPVTVTVTAVASAVTLSPDTLTLFNVAGTLTVGLPSAAGVDGLVVRLASLDPSVATVPPSVTIPPGEKTATVTVTPVRVGSTLITASVAALRPGTAQVTVGTPKIALTLSAATVGLSRTITGTVTLSAPAPPGGTVVTLTPNRSGIVTLAPDAVVIAGGSQIGSFSVTGVAEGATTIAGSSAGYTSGGVDVSVGKLGLIMLQLNPGVGLGESVPFQVSLATPAPVGGVTITLTSSNAARATVTPTVVIPQGATTPAEPPAIKGISLGSVTINASAPGFSGDSKTTTVAATLSFAPSAVTIGAGGVQNLTLNLSGPAPAGGVTVTLQSDKTTVATVPPSATILANATSVSVPVTGIAAGSANITAASAISNIAGGTAHITVSVFGSIGLPANIAVPPGQTASFPVTLSAAAPAGGVTITLASSDSSKVAITPATVFIGAGQTQPSTQPQVKGIALGAASISATGPGFGSASQTVQVGATLTFSPQTLAFAAAGTQNVTLTLSAPAPAGGLPITLTPSNKLVVTVPASVTIAQNATSVTVPVTALGSGAATITASAGTSNISNAVLNVTVQSLGAIALPANMSVGVGKSAAFPVTLPAPAPAGGVTVSLTSSDTAKLTISPATVTIAAGQTQPSQQPSVTGKSLGTANISASAAGFASASQPVIVTGTIGFTPATLTLSANTTQNLTLTLSSPAPAGGLTVYVSSSNAAAATVQTSVAIPANTTTVSVAVKGVAAGAAVIRASASGYADASANVTVTPPVDIVLPVDLVVPPGEQVAFPISLAKPATETAFVTLNISDGSKASLSILNVVISAGQTQPSSQPRITGISDGAVTITAASAGLTTANTTVRIGFALSFSPEDLNLSGSSTQGLTLTLSGPAPAGGLTVNLSSSNTSVATVPSTVSFGPNATTANVQVAGVAPGTAIIRASAANIPQATATVTVAAPGTIVLPANTQVPLDRSVAFPITLSTPAPLGGVTVKLTTSDSAKVGLSTTNVVIPQGATVPAAQPQVIGVNVGSANITASAPGYATATQAVRVNATVKFTSDTLPMSQNSTDSLRLELSGSAPLAGLTVTLTSSNPSVAAVQPSINFFPDGSEFTTVVIPVTSFGPGTAIIRASGINIPEVSATVTVIGPLTVITPSLTPGAVGVTYSQSLVAAGGKKPYVWTLTSGVLPSGLILNGTTGQIAGTPAAAVSNVPLTFRVADSSQSPQSVTANWQLTITQSPAASIAATGGTPQTAAINAPFAARLLATVKDSGGNPVSGVTVTFTPPTSGASGSFAGGVNTAVTNTSGVATSGVFTANGTAGSYLVKAAAPGVAVPANFTLTNTAGPPASITATGGTPQSAAINTGFSSRLLATVKDAGGNPVKGVTVTFTAPATGAGGTFTGGVNTAVTSDVGVATSAAFNANGTAGAYVVKASVSGVATPASFSLTNTASTAASITATGGTPQSAAINTAFVSKLIATVKDAGGNPVSGVTVTFTAPATGASGAFAGGVNTAVSNASGVATSATFTANATAGAYVVKASVPGVATPASFSLTNTASTAASITATGGTPQSAAINTAFASKLIATVKDAGGNPVSGVTVTFTAPATGASGAFAGGVNTAISNASGVATSATLTANATAGAYVVKASVPGVATPASFSLTNTSSNAASITATGGTPQSAAINTAFASKLIATVKDAGGNPVSGVTVTFTAPATGASGAFAGGVNTAVSNASGVATSATFTANATAGAYVVKASAPGVATPASFSLTNTASSVASITATGGTPQSAAINTAFASKLIATVKDAGGNPVSGVTVTFTAPATGASGAFAGGVNTAVSNASGVATSATFTANATAGSYLVKAFAPGAATPVNFTLTNTVGPAASITATGGTPQSAAINTAFASKLIATVKDAGGNPVSGVTVTFTAPASGATGTFAGGVNTAVTNASGVATSATFTANATLGTYVVAASVPGVATHANFSLTNTAGSAASITATGGTPQSAAVNTAFAARLLATVKDAAGNPVSGATVTFTPPTTGASGTFAGGVNTAVTNTSGVATSAVFTANGTLGSYLVKAYTPGAAVPVNFTLTNTAGNAASITATGGTPQTAVIKTVFLNRLLATVKDGAGNPVSGVTVTFTAPASGASAAFAGGVNTAVTNATGVATSAALTANATVGSYVITALAPGASSPATYSLTNTAGPAASITATAGTPQSASINTAFASKLVATVKDSGGNPVSGVTVTFTAPITGASGSFAGVVNTAVTNAAGVATSATFTANGTVGSYVITASVPGVGTPATFSMTNIAGSAASITATAGTPQSAAINTAFASKLIVTVKDAAGNPVNGVTVTFAPPTSGASGTFAGGVNTAVTNASGVAASATFTANATVGSYLVKAMATGAAVPANFTLTNTAGSAASITATGGTPQSAAINTAFASKLVATVKDAGGNPVNGVTVTFTAPASGASGTFAGGVNTAVTNASGVATSATFTANATAGSYVVAASAAGVSAAANFSLTNTAGSAASITATAGTPQSAAINTAFASKLVATVKDAGGNPVNGVTVTFKAPVSGASGSFAGGVNTAVTNASGVATSATFTANATTGAYVVAATVPGVTSPANFSLTNSVGAAASVTATGGTPQTADVGTAFASKLIATVKDAGGNPVSGVTVTFTAPASGASGSFAGGVNTAVTNASGVATSATFTANATAGSYAVTASALGVSTPASFSLTNAPVVTGGKSISMTSVSVGQNLETPITVMLSEPAPAGGLNVNITTSNPALALVSGRPGDPGTSQVSVKIGEGLTTVSGIYVQGLASSGTVQLTASASGFSSGTATATLTRSGFVLAGPNGMSVRSFTTNQGVNNTVLSVYPARLDSSLNFVEAQQVRPGIAVSVPISVTSTTVGSVSPASVNFVGGDSVATTTFSALASGSTTITAEVPSGFSLPAQGVNTLTGSVTPAGLVATNATVGQNLQTIANIRLNAPAPTAGLVVSLTSSNPARLLLSTSANTAGSGSITLTVQGGRTVTPDFYLQSLGNSGTVTYTASAPGFGTTTGTVTLSPSGFVMYGPFGLGADFFTTTRASNTTLSIYSARLNSTLNYVEAQEIRGGFSVNANVTSSNNAVGTITTSPVTFGPATSSVDTEFRPVSAGSTTLAVNAPAGFSTPAQFATLTATVKTPAMVLSDGLTIGKNLEAFGTLLLGEPAPAGGLTVTLTASSGQLLLSRTATGAGSTTMTLTIPAGESTGSYYLYGAGDSGTVAYTATAPGYSPKTATVNLAPSGVVIAGPFGFGYPLLANRSAGPQDVSVFTAVLDPSTNAVVVTQPLAGGTSLTVALTNSTPEVGTIASTVSIAGGTDNGVVQFTPVSIGQTTISVVRPAGYALPSNNTALIAKVN